MVERRVWKQEPTPGHYYSGSGADKAPARGLSEQFWVSRRTRAGGREVRDY